METIRILHHHAPGYGWSFDSTDVPGLIGGTESYDAANAEEAARFAPTCLADERGEVAPVDLIFEHYVPAAAAVTA
jgi:hypothetical protein